MHGCCFTCCCAFPAVLAASKRPHRQPAAIQYGVYQLLCSSELYKEGRHTFALTAPWVFRVYGFMRSLYITLINTMLHASFA